MYYSCTCVKRNGLQHDCRLTECSGEPACLVRPDSMCAPSQLARMRGLADPSALLPHIRAAAQSSDRDGSHPSGGRGGGSGGGKRFIVCEMKGIIPDVKAEAKEKKCCCSCSKESEKSSARPSLSGTGLPVLLMKLC